MLGIRRVVGNLQSIYTAGMVTGSVPNLGRMGDYRRECCPAPLRGAIGISLFI
jgi:hypothetical protein